jgi:hypothetical protein
MKRAFLLLQLVLVLALLAFICAPAGALTHLYHKDRAAWGYISGNLMVWQDMRGDPNSHSKGDIYGMDLTTGVEFPICTAPNAQSSPVIVDERWVVWPDRRNDVYDTDLYAYDLTTGQEFPLRVTPYDEDYLKVIGHCVIWRDFQFYDSIPGNNDIYAYDFTTGQEFPICTAPSSQNSESISGNIIVWEDYRDYELIWNVGYGFFTADIYGYDLATQREFVICKNENTQYKPDIFGNIVVWQDYCYDPNSADADSGADIYGLNLSTGEKFPICKHAGAQGYPKIYGTMVVWEDHRDDPRGPNPNTDIYGCDLTNGQEFPICTAPGIQESPDIYRNIVWWTSFPSFTEQEVHCYNLDTGREFSIDGLHNGYLNFYGDLVIRQIDTDVTLDVYRLDSNEGREAADVAATTPARGATGVPLASTITVSFGGAMVQNTAEAAFTITPTVAGSFSWSDNTMTFTPTAPLAAGTTYSCTVGTGATAQDGSQIIKPYQWAFTTVPPPDTITVTTTANPSALAAGGTTQLTAQAVDGRGHCMSSWSWSDNGAGGTFSGSYMHSPTWTAPGNSTTEPISYTLTVTGTCCSGARGSADITITEAARTYHLTVSADPNSGGTVTGGGDYFTGASAAITATAQTGWRFTGWTGAVADPNAAATTVSMEASKTVTAHFVQVHTLAVNASPAEGGSVSGAGSYDHNARVPVSATANPGWRFSGWTGPVADPNAAATTITMNANKTITANFVRYYTLSTTAAPASGGSVTGAGGYAAGTSAGVQALPAAGYAFDSWSGDLSGSANPTTVNMTANKAVTANFTRITYALSAPPGEGGTVSGTGSYDWHASATIEAIPAPGYYFTGWSGALSGSANPAILVMDGNKALSANFARITYILQATSSAGGTVSGAGSYDWHAAATLSATPAAGYWFAGWAGDLTGAQNPALLVMDGNKSVTASFTRYPSAPTSVSATALSSNQIRLDWSFAGTISGFRIYRRVGAGAWGTSPIATVGNTGRSYTNSALSAGLRYSYRICAYNSYGNSPAGEASATTTIYVAAPTTLVAKAASASQVNLTWIDKSTNETGFSIERRLGTTGAWAEIATVGTGSRAYSDTGAAANTLYNYRIRAIADGAASAYSNIASVKTPIYIAAPTDLVATFTSATSISLTWTDNADDETGYKIERRLSTATTWTVIKTTLANVTSFTNTGLVSGRTYIYRVRAYRSTAYSGYSNEASATAVIP